jgi:hypothetical protein
VVERQNKAVSLIIRANCYHEPMDNQDHLQTHLDLCQAVLERLKREGTWPWSDSQISEDLVESKGNVNDA